MGHDGVTRILFLCMGNICRSPAAHCVFQHMVDQAGLSQRFEIDSAGTIGFHRGAPPDPRMQAVLRARGYPIHGESRPLEKRDLDAYDLILAMDRENLADARSLSEGIRCRASIRLFSDFHPERKGEAIPDPYYGGDGGFDHVMDLIEEGCRGLLEARRN
jgi:protein-tyrosine phosphatase